MAIAPKSRIQVKAIRVSVLFLDENGEKKEHVSGFGNDGKTEIEAFWSWPPRAP